MKFLWSRLEKRWFFFAIVLAVIISGLQFFPLKTIPPEDSPYTRWLGIDSFSFAPIAFFILLPLLASIPASTLLKDDYQSGLLSKLKLNEPLNRVLRQYVSIAFITGFIVTAIPLLINLCSWFMVLPNIRPDNLLNKNILVININTMFVALYYSHPLLHALLSIIFASFWGGLFAIFGVVTSLWIKNRFLAMCSSLILQIVSLLLNAFIKLPNLVSYAPADFLHETAPTANVSLLVTGIVTLLLILYCLVMFQIDKKRLVSL